MRLRELFEMAQHNKIAEIILPDWFQRGRILSHNDLQRLDVVEFIEGEEWNHQWRLCQVPVSLLARWALSDQDIASNEQEEPGRMSSIQQMVGQTQQTFDRALKRLPVVLLLTSRGIKILDGFHRITTAVRINVPAIWAAVGLGEPDE